MSAHETVRDELRRRRDDLKVFCVNCRHYQRNVKFMYQDIPIERNHACMASVRPEGVLNYVTGKESEFPTNVHNCEIRNETGDCKHFEEKE